MIIFGVIGLFTIAIATLIWAIFVAKKPNLRKTQWGWLHQIVATFVSVTLGFSLFFLQGGLTDNHEKDVLTNALVQELKVIEEQISQVKIYHENCLVSGSGGMMVNPYLLPDTALKMSMESMLFEAHYFNHFVRLKHAIDDHNRWANFGFEIMKDPVNPNKMALIQAQQSWQEIDKDIALKTLFLKECLLYGNSPSTNDDDCI